MSQCQIESSRQKPLKPLKMTDLRDFLIRTGTNPDQNIVTFFSLHPALFDALQEVCKEKKIMFFRARPHVDFKPPKFHQAGPEWYVYYSVRNPDTGRFCRYRVKVNRGSVKERREAARQIMESLQEKLLIGWTPFSEKSAPLSGTPAFTALDAFYRVKAKELRKQSLNSYRSFLRIFRQWLTDNGASEATTMASFDESSARAYMDYLEDKDAVSPRSYNNYLSFMNSLFTWMVEKGYVGANPFQKIKRKPARLMTKRRRTLTDEELEALLEFLGRENVQFRAVCLLCMCCFLRPKEISLLRCSDVDLSRQVIHVSAEAAKNGNESYRTIPSVVARMLRPLDLSSPALYLFGRHDGEAGNFSPGVRPVDNKKFSDYWKKTVRQACGFGKDLQLYSLKDTGITRMLGEKVPISFVQQQADHHSVAMTAVYVGKSPSATDALKKADILPKHTPSKK